MSVEPSNSDLSILAAKLAATNPAIYADVRVRSHSDDVAALNRPEVYRILTAFDKALFGNLTKDDYTHAKCFATTRGVDFNVNVGAAAASSTTTADTAPTTMVSIFIEIPIPTRVIPATVPDSAPCRRGGRGFHRLLLDSVDSFSPLLFFSLTCARFNVC